MLAGWRVQDPAGTDRNATAAKLPEDKRTPPTPEVEYIICRHQQQTTWNNNVGIYVVYEANAVAGLPIYAPTLTKRRREGGAAAPRFQA